jgi:glycosyltransferase involved in cell wall biosynthesis
VLLIAELANPAWISVPLEGWCHARALARLADVHLVTHARNRANITAAGLADGRDFSALGPVAFERPLARLVAWLRGDQSSGWTLSTAADSLLYYFFERRVWRRFGAAVRAGAYDIVHRLTPLTPTAQSPLAGQCRRAGVPFVLGPLNGGLPWPRGFSSELRRQRDWLSHVRDGHKLMPYYRATRRDAAAIVAGSRATWEQLPRWALSKAVYIPENGILPERFGGARDRPAQLPLRVAFLGRLVPYKGADILIEAAAPLVREGRVTLEVIGEGPELPRLRALSASAGLGPGMIRFPGWVRHEALQQHLAEFDVLGFPSVREFGGAVVLEAMALGLVPLVVDYGGPGEHVTPATGIAVALGSREQLVARVRQALAALADDPGAVRSIGARARRRALELYSWDAKARQMLEVWRWVLGQRDKPEFGMPLPDP